MTSRGHRPSSKAREGHLAMLVFSALVAGSFALGGRIANEISPVALAALRFALAGCAIGAVAAAMRAFSREMLDAPWRYVGLGALFSSYFVLMFEGLKTASPVSTAAVFTFTPVLSAGFGWLLLRQVTTPRMALALLVGAVGALWVIFDASWTAFLSFQIGRGEAVFFWGCVAHALYAPLSRAWNRGEQIVAFTFGSVLAGTLTLVVYGARDLAATDWQGLRPMVWVTLLYLAFGASAATFVLLQVATLRLPAAKVMAYTYLVPSWVIVWEVGLGAAAPSLPLLGGVALTAIALLLLLKPEG
ncbi:MAG: DMT family transporter [Pseudomonadota bacterium]